MCTTCGCGHPDQVRIGELPHVHHDSNAQHATKLPNFSHSSFRMPDSPQQEETQQRLLKVEQDILGANNQLADMNRRFFANQHILALNLVSSPGSGKTTLLTTTLNALKNDYPCYVIEGDQQTENDADRIRQTGVDKETINTCYVTDAQKHLLGIVTLREIILAKTDENIKDLMTENVITFHTLDDQEEVAKQFQKYDFGAMPVVDNENRLVGIITVDDVMDILEEEATEDIEMMAAITPTDQPYMKTSVFDTYKKRIPWLLLLMISASITGKIIQGFETALSTYVILTAFIPMLMDTGGNCGSQASVSVIRALSLDEVEFKELPLVVWKEMKVSILVGATLAIANFAKIMLIDQTSMLVAFVVCMTLFVTVVVAKFVGCTLPILADKIGFDPAVMASPFITTIVDALSLLVYFNVAGAFLGI
mgnify:CR=1 FL=1